MDAILILLAIPAGLWALMRIAASAWGVARANRSRNRELRAAGALGTTPRSQAEISIDVLQQADRDAAVATREDYSLTGAILAGFGAFAMFAGRYVAYGQWAVGLYAAGTLAIVAGFALAIFGAVMRTLARPLLDSPSQRDDR